MAAGVFMTCCGSLETEVISTFPSCSRLNCLRFAASEEFCGCESSARVSIGADRASKEQNAIAASKPCRMGDVQQIEEILPAADRLSSGRWTQIGRSIRDII